MDRARAIRIAAKWSQGHVCALREGEAQEYHKLCLAALREQEQSKWISVKERLPPPYLDVLAYRANHCDTCLNSRAAISEYGIVHLCCLSSKKAVECMAGWKDHYVGLKEGADHE